MESNINFIFEFNYLKFEDISENHKKLKKQQGKLRMLLIFSYHFKFLLRAQRWDLIREKNNSLQQITPSSILTFLNPIHAGISKTRSGQNPHPPPPPPPPS